MTMMGPNPGTGGDEGGREHDFPSSIWHPEVATRREQQVCRGKVHDGQSVPRGVR